MSKPRKEQIKCSKCGEVNPATIWDSINPTVDPQLKEQFLAGELTTHTCPRCGHQIGLDFDLLYHDMDQRLVIWYHGEDESGARGSLPEPLAMHMMEALPYTRRLVFHLRQLMEKIYIADASLDDRVVEVMKVAALSQFPTAEQPAEDCFFFQGIDGPRSKRYLEFAIVDDLEQTRIVELPLEHYHELEVALSPHLMTAAPGAPGWATVDRSYALQLMARLE